MQRGKGAELTPLSAPLLVWTEAHATDLEDVLLAIGLFDDRPHDRFQIESHETPGREASLGAGLLRARCSSKYPIPIDPEPMPCCLHDPLDVHRLQMRNAFA